MATQRPKVGQIADKFLVIGSNSFSGSHFVNHALNLGASVIGISRSDEPSSTFLPYKTNDNIHRFLFHKLDLNCDLDRIMGVITDFAPDYVINFAAQSMVAESWHNPEHWFMTNVVSNVKLHDKLRQCKFLKKYVHISTPEVYGSCSGSVKESGTAFNPSTPYAVSRAACDMSLMSFFSRYQFPVCFTRASNVYGPGQQLYRIIPKTILSIMMHRKLQLHGGGQSVRSFIHIQDVMEGTLSVALDASVGEVYHLSTDRYISIRSLVDLICSKMNVRFEDTVELVDDRPGKDAAYLLDSTKARARLGWSDRVSLERGVNETITWVESNLEEIKKQPSEYTHKA